MCRFSDNLGALSEYLMQYSTSGELKMGWPSMVLNGDSGYALKIVTNIGVVEMQSTSASARHDTFQAELGKGRALVIQFSETLLRYRFTE